jgi:hypothetical protein
MLHRDEHYSFDEERYFLKMLVPGQSISSRLLISYLGTRIYPHILWALSVQNSQDN